MTKPRAWLRENGAASAVLLALFAWWSWDQSRRRPHWSPDLYGSRYYDALVACRDLFEGFEREVGRRPNGFSDLETRMDASARERLRYCERPSWGKPGDDYLFACEVELKQGRFFVVPLARTILYDCRLTSAGEIACRERSP